MTDAPSDAELLDAWRSGDEACGRELFARHFDPVFRFFRNKVDEAAEDLTQQTFMALVRGVEQFRGDASFRTYVFTIARKRLYSYLRSRDRQNRLVELPDASIADLGWVSPSRVVAAHEEQNLLLLGLRRLPVDMQLALELFYWEDLTVFEIAEVLDAPVGTVKSRLKRARARLEQVLKEMATHDEGAVRLLESTLGNLDLWARGLQAQLRERSGGLDPARDGGSETRLKPDEDEE